MDNYTIVLFKNKTKKKIIKKFKTYNNAKKYYQDLLTKNKLVIFDMNTENGKGCKYEIGLVGRHTGSTNSYFVRDDFGRTLKVELEDPDFNILEINPYKKEEMLYDIKKSKRISVSNFLKNYVPKVGVKLISKINHKIAVQNDDQVNLFSLKTEQDCNRFIDSLSEYMMLQGRIDTILVKDSSFEQKKYLYDVLESNGYSKSILYRRFTTYKR
jgi:hypothetical protein